MTLHLPTPVRNARPIGDAAWEIVEPVHVALVRLLESTSEDITDLWKVAMAINLTWARCQSIGDGEAGIAMCRSAGEVLTQCEVGCGGRTLAPFTPEQRQRVIDAIALYEATVRASSPLQLEQAQRAVMRMSRPRGRKAVHA